MRASPLKISCNFTLYVYIYIYINREKIALSNCISHVREPYQINFTLLGYIVYCWRSFYENCAGFTADVWQRAASRLLTRLLRIFPTDCHVFHPRMHPPTRTKPSNPVCKRGCNDFYRSPFIFVNGGAIINFSV